jgi:hypothetical protein
MITNMGLHKPHKTKDLFIRFRWGFLIKADFGYYVRRSELSCKKVEAPMIRFLKLWLLWGAVDLGIRISTGTGSLDWNGVINRWKFRTRKTP